MSRINNEFRFTGNVGAPPEIRFNPNNGKPIAEVSLAVDMSYRDDRGDLIAITDWMPITFYNEGQIEKVIKPYVKSGREITVQGVVRKRVKQDDDSLADGKKPRWFEFVATDIQLHGGAKGGDGAQANASTATPAGEEEDAREPAAA